MDEIDAALDFKNVSIVGYYIKVFLGFNWLISGRFIYVEYLKIEWVLEMPLHLLLALMTSWFEKYFLFI